MQVDESGEGAGDEEHVEEVDSDVDPSGLDYTTFGNRTRTVYFDDHPGDSLTLEDAQRCFDRVFIDMLHCVSTPGVVSYKCATQAGGGQLSGGVGRAPQPGIDPATSTPPGRGPPAWRQWRTLRKYFLLLPRRRVKLASGRRLKSASVCLQAMNVAGLAAGTDAGESVSALPSCFSVLASP